MFLTTSIKFQRQIDKVGDLLDASNNCQSPRAAHFKETAQILKQEMRAFNDRLEELRERLEDTSRCFELLNRCQSLTDDGKTESFSELLRLAAKSGNENLIERCQVGFFCLRRTVGCFHMVTLPFFKILTQCDVSSFFEIIFIQNLS